MGKFSSFSEPLCLPVEIGERFLNSCPIELWITLKERRERRHPLPPDMRRRGLWSGPVCGLARSCTPWMVCA